MENNNVKRPRRQRISAGDKEGLNRNAGPAKAYSSSNGSYGKPSYGAKKSYGYSSDKPSYGAKKSYGTSSDKPSYGRKSYGSSYGSSSDKPSYGHKTYGESSERPAYKKNYSHDGDNKGGYKKSFGGPRQGGYGKKNDGFRKPAPRRYDDSLINQMIDKRAKASAELSDNDNVNIPVKETVRLNKFIANSGICSRREADNYILAGVVTVNGEVVTELGSKVNIYTDEIRFNGEKLKGEEKVYIVMNKPKGYVTTASDPHADKTVMDLLKGCKARVFAVGRLDKNTTGVLMFTNDGEMAEKLTHPSYDKRKIYQVSLDHDLTKDDYDKVMTGIELTDGPIAADDLQYIEENDKRKVGIEIHSGKNRIVRRIFESLGYEVKALDRVYFAGLTKKGLKRGEWRYLSEGEVNILKIGAYK